VIRGEPGGAKAQKRTITMLYRVLGPGLILLRGVFCSMGCFNFLPAFIVYMNRFQIEPEEKTLACKFGQEFDAYTSRPQVTLRQHIH
jgi:protein-S-isoprenylcysteine O-methyltransferase Ste14